MVPRKGVGNNTDPVQHPLVVQNIFSGIPSWVELEDVSEISSFINDVLPDPFPVTGAFHAAAIPNETGKFHFESLRFQGKLVQVVHIRTGDRLMGFGVDFVRRDHPDLLLLRVADLENHVQVLIESHRMSDSSAKEFDGDYIILIDRRELQGKVVAFLHGGITGESGIIGNILQGACDLIVANSNSRLQSTYVLAENFRPTVFGLNRGTY